MEPNSQVGQPDNASIDDVSALDLVVVLAKHKLLVIGLTVLTAAAAAAISLLLPNIYTASASFLPPLQPAGSAAAALLSQMGGSFVGPSGGALGPTSRNDLYIGMLKSRRVTDRLIERFELNKVYNQELQINTRRVLEGNTSFNVGKDGIITVDVDDKDPKRASDVANAYVEELMKLTSVLAVTEASQRRLFYEQQLAQARENMIAAEMAARQGLEKGGIAKVDDQGRAMVELTARLRAQISVKEVQIGTMQIFASERNPELHIAQQELLGLKRELARLEGTLPNPSPIALGKGSSGLENLSRLRDMKYYETIYEMIARQFELAKLDEAKDASVLQVLDQAVVPERKSKPRRGLIVVLSAVGSFVLAIFIALLLETWQRARQNPRNRTRLALLKDNLYRGWQQRSG